MISQAIDIHHIDQGLDRKQLSQIKQRFLHLNQQRLQRALQSLSERQQVFLQLLPLLFHVNHPQLPGYHNGQVPAGIAGFEPDKEALRLAKTLARSFHYKRDLNEKAADIDALFVMGSVGSIGYSDTSDLDIWVCYRPLLDEPGLMALEHKCVQISTWAQQHINLEVHFFLMTGERFQAGHVARLSREASGSAQHFLLLDEFYRTALWLAGKVPLWWFVPATQEANYLDFAQQLLSKRFIKVQEVIDFGGLPQIPANEFIGAGIWQLYKAIESPHKSVLKLLLLEVYATSLSPGQTGCQQTLALQFKQQVYTREPAVDELDPYVMIYRRVEAYLQTQSQSQRLELVRRCFYFKANKPLSKKPATGRKSWQRLLLEKLVADWHWSNHLLHMLDNRAYWKSPHVIAERALLVNELNHSYRLLLELNRQQDHQVAISADELMILGRKLHAAFERKAGKIEWINPGISRDLSEPALCLVQVASEGEENWQLLRGSQSDLSLRSVSVEPIKRARSLLELLLWSQANGLLVRGTRVDIVSKDYQLTQVQKQQLLQRLEQWLPSADIEVHQAFTRAAYTEQMLWLVNLGVEPQAQLLKKGMQKLSSQRDALGFSGLKENLVLSADLVIRNSWGEVTVRRFTRDALINALLYCLRLLPTGNPQLLPSLSVDCFSLGQGASIAQRLAELWREIINCYYTSARPQSARYIVEMGDEYLLLQFLHHQPHISRFKTYEKLLEKLAQPQADFSPLVADSYALRDKPLGAICPLLSARGVYVFYLVKGALAELTLVDEKGSLFHCLSPYFNQQTFLRPLLGFVRASLQHLHWDGDLPGRLERDPIQVYELELHASAPLVGSRQCQYQLRGRQQQVTLETSFSLQIKVIAEPDHQGGFGYNIFCNEQEFSSLALGEQLYIQVANFIVQHRQTNERYPCYISDLDLSQCRDIIAQQTGLQLNHYLRLKVELEARLNQALLQL